MNMNGTMKTLVRKPDEMKKYNEGTDNQNSWNIMISSKNRWEKLIKSNDNMHQ